MNVPADERCEIVAVALQKGGVGKTTTTINLGANLAAMGVRVLVIDMDQQAHSTKGLGIELGADDASMYEVLHPDRAMRVPLATVIRPSPCGISPRYAPPASHSPQSARSCLRTSLLALGLPSKSASSTYRICTSGLSVSWTSRI
ncbi:ParA family protein [Mycobacterium avium]|uniref:ParA family protein n=1 Tax=Mycobacterium avium TaxID=1764 RepID=UPI000B128CBC|nr:AAA family ATPase [Mycobacterium avium]